MRDEAELMDGGTPAALQDQVHNYNCYYIWALLFM